MWQALSCPRITKFFRKQEQSRRGIRKILLQIESWRNLRQSPIIIINLMMMMMILGMVGLVMILGFQMNSFDRIDVYVLWTKVTKIEMTQMCSNSNSIKGNKHARHALDGTECLVIGMTATPITTFIRKVSGSWRWMHRKPGRNPYLPSGLVPLMWAW